MPVSSLEEAYFRSEERRVEQGDLLRDLRVLESQAAADGIEVADRAIPYCVVLSQDCDLDQDFASRAVASRADDDKFLRTVLVAPAYEAESFRAGTHLEGLGQRMRAFGTKELDRVKQNSLPRYHFLPGHPPLQLPDLVIDFKHFLTIPRDVLYRAVEWPSTYLATIEILFREHLSSRFAQFVSRIGLPESSPDA